MLYKKNGIKPTPAATTISVLEDLEILIFL